ncbi:MAG: transaldolase family protein [Ilumatobacteraceae bacterium]
MNTLPDATIEAFADHGTLGRTIDAGVDEAEQVWTDLQAVGVDLDDVAATLEADGVASFQKSFTELLGALGDKASRVPALTWANPRRASSVSPSSCSPRPTS